MSTQIPQIHKRMQRLPFWLAAALFLAFVSIISGPRVFAALAGTEESLYIVTLSDAPLTTYSGGLLGLPATSPAAAGSLRLDPTTPASVAYRNYLATQQSQVLGSMELALGRPLDVAFQYDTVLNGFAVTLTGAEANTVATLPDVADVSIDIDMITAVGSIVGDCGGITDNPNSIEFWGDGTYNGTAASFRVCAEDNNGTRAVDPDHFYLECLSGCSYSTGDRAPDNGLDGGGAHFG